MKELLNKKILIVDDEKELLQSVGFVIEKILNGNVTIIVAKKGT